uniref:Uncharacterized protein n=1 Tax=Rhizophora mucronata TaxID=61149 RepID=A0A2P2PXL9_RHIMU
MPEFPADLFFLFHH